MDDSWSFRTERGRAWVSGGTLRVEGSVAGALRSTYRRKWKRARPTWKALYLFSFAGTAMWFGRVIPALRALGGGEAVSSFQWFVLAATAVVALATMRRAGRSERVPLEHVETVRRADRTVTVEYVEDGEDRSLDIEALTDEDADEAVDILRLKGVRVEDSRGSDGESTSRTFRERLAKKAE